MRSRIDQVVEEETANSSFSIFNNEEGPSPSTSKLLTKQDIKVECYQIWWYHSSRITA